MENKEIWKSIPHNDRYHVSNFGRVRSKKKNNNWLILKATIASNGYRVVAIGRGNHKTVHSLVALCFIGVPNGLQVNHKNGIKTDNRVENLEYITQGDNIRHAFSTGLMNNTGQFHGRTKLSNIDALIIREAREKGHKLSSIAKYYKAPIQTICNIVKHRSFKYI